MSAETAHTKARRLLAEGRVRIKWASDQLTVAAVRGDSSIYDVRWTRLQGWSCSCACFGRGCSHIAAVRAVTTRPLEPA